MKPAPPPTAPAPAEATRTATATPLPRASDAEAAAAPSSRLHLPCLLLGLGLMLAGTLYPPLFADAQGKADHGLAMLFFWSMSVGFIRGVGFVPRARLWRLLFSPAACLVALLAALGLKLSG